MSTVGLNEDAVSTWIAGLGVGAVAPLSFERIGNGQSNLTFAVRDSGGGRWVLRRPPLGQLLDSAHDVVREHRILSALQGTGVPVPKMLALTTDPTVTDAPLVLMSYVDGLVIDGGSAAGQLDSARRRVIGLSLPKALASIHRVDLEMAGLLDLASRNPYAERQLKRWSAQWAQSKTQERPEVEDVAARLARNVPEQAETTLVHGDFHLGNVITAPGDGGVVAVLDWELCTLGDPLADLGGLLAYWPQRSDGVVWPFTASTLEGFPTRDELVDVYIHETKRDVSAVGFWHVLALWKLAIISEGVVRRTADDPRNRAEFGGPTREFVDSVVRRAVATADAVGLD
ncbi:phosphotransferase family protein [Rhodococcus sp. ABRD24]|uniref:phosphotransferase family protein n=1 Tax=Rhodococcus sp. ABRD24 TaxID=2507582 RepID=UPI00103B381B|nr:phosphotransferase family protein [Rhodococcus sp. ABRD24]QBJ97916.1 phosphotransferase family protein [Rhodococcus sp. ABRD24]